MNRYLTYCKKVSSVVFPYIHSIYCPAIHPPVVSISIGEQICQQNTISRLFDCSQCIDNRFHIHLCSASCLIGGDWASIYREPQCEKLSCCLSIISSRHLTFAAYPVLYDGIWFESSNHTKRFKGRPEYKHWWEMILITNRTMSGRLLYHMVVTYCTVHAADKTLCGCSVFKKDRDSDSVSWISASQSSHDAVSLPNKAARDIEAFEQ